MTGVPCMRKSKISKGFVSLPFISILDFSSKCGSGTNGANPRKIAIIARIGRGILSINLSIKP